MRKRISWLLAVLLLVSLLTGCGAGESSSNTQASVSAVGSISEEPAAVDAAPETTVTESVEAETLPEESSEAEATGADETAEDEDPPNIAAIPDDGFFPLQEPATLTMFFTYPPIDGTINGPEDYVVFQEAEDRLNVHIDFNAVSIPASADAFQLLVASGDYPDILPEVARNYNGGMSKALEDDVIVDLSDHLSDYAPHYQAARMQYDANMRNTMADDGSVYGFYLLWTLDDATPDSGLAVRQDWLNALGMDIPVTIDELHDVLLGMQSLGCQNPYDITWTGNSNEAILEAYDCAWSYGKPGLVAIDGVITASATADGTYEYIKMMNKWFNEGLIDPDFYSQFSYALSLRDSIINESRGVFFIQNANIDTFQSAIGGSAVIAPMASVGFSPDQEFHTRAALGTDNSSFTITTDCSDLELAMRYLDWFYSEEGEILCNYGVEGQSFEYDADGIPQYTELITNNEVGQNTAITLYTGYKAVPNMLISSRLNSCNSESYNAAGIKWGERQDAAYFVSSNVSLTTEENDRISLILSEIETYTEEHLIKMIVGEEDVETVWDTYCGALEDMGLEEVIEVYQAAYDRYMERG